MQFLENLNDPLPIYYTVGISWLIEVSIGQDVTNSDIFSDQKR